MKKCIHIIFIFAIIFTKSHSQTLQQGCLIGEDSHPTRVTGLLGPLVEILIDGRPVYQLSPIEPRIGSCVSLRRDEWRNNNLGSCYVCTQGVLLPGILGGTLGCIGGNVNRREGVLAYKYLAIVCPLDDYSWAFGASAAALGIFVIRKRKI